MHPADTKMILKKYIDTKYSEKDSGKYPKNAHKTIYIIGNNTFMIELLQS